MQRKHGGGHERHSGTFRQKRADGGKRDAVSARRRLSSELRRESTFLTLRL